MHITINKRYAKGLTLLEVLIALLVLSIGLLGIAGLQLTGLRENQNAHFRTQAVYLANDMADRMRANPTGNYNNIDNFVNNPYEGDKPACADTCTAAEIVQRDAWDWLSPKSPTSITSLLPIGKGQITDNGDGTFSISVLWDDDRQGTGTKCGADEDGIPPDENENLRCLSVQFTL
jgi:type IV pilus assembly protein PilV